MSLQRFNARFDSAGELRALPWLEPLQSSVADVMDSTDLAVLEQLEDALAAAHQTDGGSTRALEGPELLAVKRNLAASFGALDVPRRFGGAGRSMQVQLAAQFVCGYYDLNLRDCAHVGHGRMIVDTPSVSVKEAWLERVLRGELVGVAVTEPLGGSRLRNIRLRGVGTDLAGVWAASGRKVWISRISEAAAFIVFLLLGDDTSLSAAAVDANSKGLYRHPSRAEGLTGWSWGELEFDGVLIAKDSLLGARGEGLHVFNRHFAYYRPIVGATALGAGARLFDVVAERILSRHGVRDIGRILDSSTERLGRCYGDLVAGLMHVFTAGRLVTAQHPDAVLWAKLAKVGAVEAALRAAEHLTPLLGAEGYAADHPASRIVRDLRAFLFADGIHDALVQSSGRALLAPWLREGIEAETLIW